MTQSGTVKWFNNAKGYGFIQAEAGGDDIFVHHTSIVAEGFRTLNQGERVNFEVVEGPKGLQARNVLRPAAGSSMRVTLGGEEGG
jgi:cold shock protein